MIQQFVEIFLLGLTIFFESGGDGYQSKIAHGWVVKNRVEHKLFADTYDEVIFHPKHFSCYNPTEIEKHKKRLNSNNKLERKSLRICMNIADSIFHDVIPDNTDGALWYAEKYEYRNGKKKLLKRKWMNNLIISTEIDGTVYYKLKGEK
jgi:spore germination cell wall hydrolase CwlJ-like protein